MTKVGICRIWAAIWPRTPKLLSIVIYNNNIDRVGNIKNKIADVTVAELRTEIYQKATGKNRNIQNNFSKNQLFQIAKELGIIEGSKCYFCDETDSSCLETHHIIPRRMNGPDNQENLVTLCANCHRKIEDLYDPIKLNTIVEQIEETQEKTKEFEYPTV